MESAGYKTRQIQVKWMQENGNRSVRAWETVMDTAEEGKPLVYILNTYEPFNGP